MKKQLKIKSKAPRTSKQKAQKQLSLFKNDTKRFHGGMLLYKKRKSRRPFSTSEPLHLVLRSRWAGGRTSFLHKSNKSAIMNILILTARKYGVKLYQKSIVGNHLHLLILCPHKNSYHAFVSIITGRIAQHVMRNLSYKEFVKSGAGGGQYRAGISPDPSTELHGKDQQFWDFRPFSRVIYWGSDFKHCCAYVKQNTLEALGFITYSPRKNYYSRWLEITYPLVKMDSILISSA